MRPSVNAAAAASLDPAKRRRSASSAVRAKVRCAALGSVYEPLDFVAKLAAFVPRPHKNRVA
jgi:hypothetical protein